ncbi:hypothetical protein BVAD3_31810 [Bacillus velezensis]|nr:hypothetical protein BVAD3_31810 [Bacillus velezensis]
MKIRLAVMSLTIAATAALSACGAGGGGGIRQSEKREEHYGRHGDSISEYLLY